MSIFKNIIKHNLDAFYLRYINKLTGIQFEHFTGKLIKKLGSSHIKVTRPSGDFGIDVIGIINNIKVGIQCKHFRKPYSVRVGYRAVEEADAGKDFYNLDKGIVLTNATFTKHAKIGAKRTNIELWDKNKLNTLISISTLLSKNKEAKNREIHNLKNKINVNDNALLEALAEYKVSKQFTETQIANYYNISRATLSKYINIYNIQRIYPVYKSPKKPAKNKKKTTAEIKQDTIIIRDLYQSGLSESKITKLTHLSKSTVVKALNYNKFNKMKKSRLAKTKNQRSLN